MQQVKLIKKQAVRESENRQEVLRASAQAVIENHLREGGKLTDATLRQARLQRAQARMAQR